MDSRPDLFREFKIQPKQHISAAEQWACTKTVLSNHFFFELPQMMAFHHGAVFVGMRTFEVPLPSLKTMAWQLALFFLVEGQAPHALRGLHEAQSPVNHTEAPLRHADTYHYWAHRLFHLGPLYRAVHKLHHKYTAPFGLAAEYSHPLEILLFGLGTVFGPLICCYFFGEMHLATMFAWITLRMLQAIDSHCGYDFPYSLRHIFPLWAGADHHDYHHQAFKGCYASSFRHWDAIMGTGEPHEARTGCKDQSVWKLTLAHFSEGNYHKLRLQQRREKALKSGKIVFGRKDMAREMGEEETVKVE